MIKISISPAYNKVW